MDLSDGRWEDSVATYYCDKDYALVGTATRTCEGDSGWSGTEPECIYGKYLLKICSVLQEYCYDIINVAQEKRH